MPERKTLNEDLFYKGSSANLPRLHTCKNKVPFWDFSRFAVTFRNLLEILQIVSYLRPLLSVWLLKNYENMTWWEDSYTLGLQIESLVVLYFSLQYKFLFKFRKLKVCSPDGDTDYFDIVTGVLQGDTLAPYLFIICLDYMLRTSIDLMKKKTVSS